ncbi:RNaseH domain-containing protein [Kitasatospora sp. NPDC091335]|uniref:RNaseH domain-containing protein n=1 Tax=Kitasatospora sp. NPDC091335 TaxID=3364085 RepID=UPI00380CFC10
MYTWPPERLVDNDGATGLYTHRTSLRVLTEPHDGRLIIRATPHIARFGAAQPAYIPRRGGGPAQATLLLYLPKGAMRSVERPSLLTAPVTVTGSKLGMRWQALPSVARVLPSLPSSRCYPDPEQVRTRPQTAHGSTPQEPDGTSPHALLLHATGYTYYAPTGETPQPDTTTHDHPVETGLQPVDHLRLFEHLTKPLAAFGFTAAEPVPKPPQRRVPRLEAARPSAHYALELWHSHPNTYEAIHTALTGVLDYRHLGTDPADRDLHHYGDADGTLSLRLLNPNTLTSGLPKPEKDTKPEDRSAHRAHERRNRIDELTAAFPGTGNLVGCLVEIDKPVVFALAGQDDPKPLLKQTLPRLDRHVQCLHPVTRKPNPESKKSEAKPYPGSGIRTDDVHRAASSVRDILRSVGHLPRLPRPCGIKADFEIVTVHIANSRNGIVPYVLRTHTDGTTTGQLIPTAEHPREAPVPIQDLPLALTTGRGRIPSRERSQLADFIIQALAIDSPAPRLFLARAQSLRRADTWQWLQNAHITPNRLRLPGEDCTVALPGAPRTPTDLPGLRIVRVNEATYETPLAFGVNPPPATANLQGSADTPAEDAEHSSVPGPDMPFDDWGRVSGVVRWNDHTYMAINPRPDTQRLSKSASKYDSADNLHRHGANPHSLEIHISFRQPKDNSSDLAAYVNNLRRCHLHTDTHTALPWLLHHAKLLEEYID